MPPVDPHAGHAHSDAEMPRHHEAPRNGPTAIDPVCGMTVTLKPDTRTESFGGKDFHFCSGKCQTKFKADPWFYASGRAAGLRRPRARPLRFFQPEVPTASRRSLRRHDARDTG